MKKNNKKSPKVEIITFVEDAKKRMKERLARVRSLYSNYNVLLEKQINEQIGR